VSEYPSEGSGLKIPILFGIVIALLAANVYLFLQLDQVKTEVATMRESIANEVSNLKETSSMSTQASRRNLERLKEELEAARRQAAMAAGQAKADAQRHADELSARLAAETKRTAEAVKTELSTKVAEVASAADTKIGAVSTEVGTVKQEVASTKSELDKTIAELKRTNGDLGVQSGLIATNAKELAALKALGDRNYFEFNLTKQKAPVRLADITILLKRSDPKRNRYTIELVADDKKFEKKDKTVNEPVQFYMSKYRQPYELVVNEVGKDKIVGYLSQPKVQAARN
jgi:chromosome segregation ATPase